DDADYRNAVALWQVTVARRLSIPSQRRLLDNPIRFHPVRASPLCHGRGFHQKVPHLPISCVRDALSTTSSVSMLILALPRRYDSIRRRAREAAYSQSNQL